jgi:O-antigen/teichoic acid export membrane protein
MSNSRIKNSSKNMIFGFTNKITMLFLPFITRTIIIYMLGSKYIGLDSLFTSIFQMLNFAEIGFGSAMVFNMYKPIADNDKPMICAILNLYRKVYRIIGSIVLGIGLAIMPFLNYLVHGTYPSGINVYIIYSLYLLNTVLGFFFFAYKSSLLTAHQNDSVSGKVATILHIIMYTLQIVVLLLFKNYYMYVILLPLYSIAFNIIISLIVDKLYPQFVCNGLLKKEKSVEIKKNVIGLIGYRLESYAQSSVDNIIISLFMGLSVLAGFNNYYYIISALGGLLTVFYLAITASIGDSIYVESLKKNIDDFDLLNFINVWVVGWCSICLLCLYQHFITIWIGKSYLLSLETMILFTVYFLVNQLRRIVVTYRDAAGLWWYDKKRPYIVVGLNAFFDILLIKPMGINGVLISTIILSAFISIPWEALILFRKYLKKSMSEYYKRNILLLVELSLICVLTYSICSIIHGTGIISFIVKLFVCILFPNTIFILINFKSKEFKRINTIFKFFIK